MRRRPCPGLVATQPSAGRCAAIARRSARPAGRVVAPSAPASWPQPAEATPDPSAACPEAMRIRMSRPRRDTGCPDRPRGRPGFHEESRGDGGCTLGHWPASCPAQPGTVLRGSRLPDWQCLPHRPPHRASDRPRDPAGSAPCRPRVCGAAVAACHWRGPALPRLPSQTPRPARCVGLPNQPIPPVRRRASQPLRCKGRPRVRKIELQQAPLRPA